MINKRKKVVKYRGSKTHGGGSKKKRRGAGNRGGKGMAGSGKRADQKKPTILKLYGPSYFGRFGFKRPQKIIKNLKTINIGDLNKFESDNLNLKEIGFDKLLGKGNIKRKITIKVDYASKNAIEKIKKSGGNVTLNVNDKKTVVEPSRS